jgi:hypothetical protein
MSEDHDGGWEGIAAGPNGLRAVPGLVRIALSTCRQTATWSVKTSLQAPKRTVEIARSPHKALDLARELTDLVARRPRRDPTVEPSRNGRPEALRAAGSLREEGEKLLRMSRDVHYEVDSHPAYERILTQLAPDEARILRLMLLDGPQPAVDVRTGGPVGLLHSRLIAPGLSMIGARAGCRYVDRVPSYLNNLFRLGLIWFSRETLHDPLRYQVLEAQPDVATATDSVRYAKIVRRSVHLTPFGEDFCRACLAPETGVPADVPTHSEPEDRATTPQPPPESVDRR